MSREITQEEKDKVLGQIGMLTIRKAVASEGMLTSNALNLVVDWHKAETWVKKKASEAEEIEEVVLREILMDLIRERAKAEIENHK